jgi:hypothetical protein
MATTSPLNPEARVPRRRTALWTLGAALVAGCGEARLQPGGIGPYPRDYEAIVKDHMQGWSIAFANLEDVVLAKPVPGVVTTEWHRRPTRREYGWLVRVTGVNRVPVLGLFPKEGDERHDF